MADALRGAVAGAVGGMMGTALLHQGSKLAPRLPRGFQPPAFKRDPAVVATEKAEELIGRDLTPRLRRGVATGFHFAYGAFWPTALGIAVRHSVFRTLPKTLATGLGLGAGVWALGYLGWMPRARLMEGKSERHVGRQATALAGHVGYGLLGVAPLYLAAKLFPRRRRKLLGFI